MYSDLTKEEIMEWRRSTEKITLEEFATRIGKSIDGKKKTKDLHDIILKKEKEPIEENISDERKPDFELQITFHKKLNKREELVFNYFCRNKNKKVFVKDIAKLLGLPNDYVYKYIKNLRSKLTNTAVLENAEQGGYIFNP